jgi:hypothetical protein
MKINIVNKEKILKDEFINKIEKIEKDIYGSEDYGDFTEYYNEEGAVILVTTIKDNNTISFDFLDGSPAYIFKEQDTKEQLNTLSKIGG